MKKLFFTVLAFFLCWSPLLFACPLCVATNVGNSSAYQVITLVMVLLPLLMGVGLGWWIRDLVKKNQGQ